MKSPLFQYYNRVYKLRLNVFKTAKDKELRTGLMYLLFNQWNVNGFGSSHRCLPDVDVR